MAGNFSLKKFSDIDLNDPFFDSLKADYPVGGKVKPFEVWFPEKAQEGRTALVFDDENGLGAFVCIKDETENIAKEDQMQDHYHQDCRTFSRPASWRRCYRSCALEVERSGLGRYLRYRI